MRSALPPTENNLRSLEPGNIPLPDPDENVACLPEPVVMPRMMELPRYESDGAPAGVKLPTDEGGGPAGVVEGSFPKAKTL